MPPFLVVFVPRYRDSTASKALMFLIFFHRHTARKSWCVVASSSH